jgi:aminomethyltransferase
MQVVSPEERSAGQVSGRRRGLTALISGCGVYRPDRVLISFSGRDRVRWLNGMVSNNIRDLAPNRGVYAFVLNPQGHILGDLYVFHQDERLIGEIERTQLEALLGIFRKYIIMDKVEITDLGDQLKVIGIAGVNSRDVLASCSLDRELNALEITAAEWNGASVTVLRGDNPCFPNYEVWVPAQAAESLQNRLLEAGAELVGEDALETLRVVCGIPRFGIDIRERTLPQETGQDRALNFTKGCYIGQEIVERIRSRGAVHRVFAGFELEGPVPQSGAKIQNDGKDVGEITSVLAAPLQGKRLALGYIRREFMGADGKLDSGETRIKPRTLPFLDMFET